MKEKFAYNPKTHRLHIVGYCCHTEPHVPPEWMTFDTEDDALAYDGRAVGLCKLCQKARERKLEVK